MTDRVTQYAQDVVSGNKLSTAWLEQPAIGKTQILACKRHLHDMERIGTEDFPYVWNIEKSLDIVDFAESLVLAEGDEPQPLKCRGFQDFIFGSWNGWVHKDTGYRRFRTSYVQIARQNGKSLGNAVPALYYGNFDGYQYPQIYCVATKEAQAKIVLKETYKFINADEELKTELFTIKDYRSEVECNLTNGTIKALGRDTESIDGFRPYFGSVDEYHKHKTNQMYKLLTGGTRKLKQCLVSIITTAGFDLNSPCKGEYDYAIGILYGLIHDDTHFVFISELDEEDKKGDIIFNEDVWPKANPLWTEETLTSLRADAIKAKEKRGDELRDFMTKALNIWVEATDNGYLDLEKWKACENNTTLADMEGREFYMGIDLSSGGDLTSIAFEFPLKIKDENGVKQRKYFIDSHSFMPAKRLEEHEKTDKAPYRMWSKDGLLTLTETLGGIKTDYKYIIQYCKEQIKKYDLKLMGIGYDPHNADAFLSDLDEFGVNCTMITQSAKNLNTPTEDFQLGVKAKEIIYDKKNKLLAWSFTYAKIVRNSFKEMKIDKESRMDRIDPCDAVIDAHKLAMLHENIVDINKAFEEGWSL